MKEIIQVAEKEGFEVRDVVPDGNCMFAAVIDQLAIRGDFTHDAKSLREMAVHWLIENPRSSDGTHFSSFLEEEWDKYLQVSWLLDSRFLTASELFRNPSPVALCHMTKSASRSRNRNHLQLHEPAVNRIHLPTECIIFPRHMKIKGLNSP